MTPAAAGDKGILMGRVSTGRSARRQCGEPGSAVERVHPTHRNATATATASATAMTNFLSPERKPPMRPDLARVGGHSTE
jgi:hypothetical protein